jgi:hypothetical protein
MKFTVAGSKIICGRKDNTVQAAEQYRQVVTFDAHVRTVPPHVAAKLVSGEILELENFLADRKRIQSNPTETNMLEALPKLLVESTKVLHSVDELNGSLYERLRSSLANMTEELKGIRHRPNGREIPIQGMRESEALKERLEDIKQDL